MSVVFDDASVEYLETTDASLPTDWPLTVGVWFKSDDAAIDQALFGISDKDTAPDNAYLTARGAVAGDPVRVNAQSSGEAGAADTSTGYSTNTWHHACGVWTSDTSRAAFIDGGSKGTDTTTVSIDVAWDRMRIGYLADSTPALPFSGKIAEVAIWTTALSDSEVSDLAGGKSPLEIQYASLYEYWPLIDLNDLVGRIGGVTLSQGGTPTSDAADHPDIHNIDTRHKRFSMAGLAHRSFVPLWEADGEVSPDDRIHNLRLYSGFFGTSNPAAGGPNLLTLLGSG